jgi:hypothetical protein
MTPDARLGGTMLAEGPLHNIEITQCIKDATEATSHPRDVVVSGDLDFVFPILGHPRCGRTWASSNL